MLEPDLVELTSSLEALEENFANCSAEELDRIRDRLWQLIERHAEAMATAGDPQRAEEVRLVADRIGEIASVARKPPPKAALQPRQRAVARTGASIFT